MNANALKIAAITPLAAVVLAVSPAPTRAAQPTSLVTLSPGIVVVPAATEEGYGKG